MDRTTIISRWQSNIPLPEQMPTAMKTQQPSVAGIMGIGCVDSGLTPLDVVQRMPSIVTPAPVDMGATACDPFTAWVSSNPLLALGGLGLVAWLLMKGKA